MGFQIVNQNTILEHALQRAREAKARLWITSPWITSRAANLLLQDALPRVRKGELEVRIVYRVKEATDLEITDLDTLKAMEDSGCLVRYSTRLHAKLLLIDRQAAIVSSSNLTSSAGYGLDMPSTWRNEELGILVEDEPDVISELEQQFLAIWEHATSVEAGTIGIAMDFPTAQTFSFVAIRDVRLGEYATTRGAAGELIVGRIADVTAYNRSFPRMSQPMWLTQGYAPPGEQRGPAEIPDLQSLFSHASKEHGFLVTKTFFEPESVFRIAKVAVLKHLRDGHITTPSAPAVPGADVSRATPEVLRALLGKGDLNVGSVLHHPEVTVSLRGSEILSKHLAILGMTGSGKSNALKVLLRSLADAPAYTDLRIVIIDTHGEYAPIAQALASEPVIMDVELRRSVLDEAVVKELLRLPRRDDAILQKLGETADRMPEEASLDDFLAVLEDDASLGGPVAAKLRRLAELSRERDDLCLWPDQGARIVRIEGGLEDLGSPGLYVLDLRATAELEARSAKAAALMRHVFRRSKETLGGCPALVAIDEAQNYAPEQQTGWLIRVRPSFDAIFAIASEGRKFNVGLVVSTQRPARVNKDILSQCNTHMIFRVANVEDLAAIAGSFEAASRPLLEELPGFDTGVCVIGGTAVDMVVRADVPLFEGIAVAGVEG
jgi:DNA helicase HerA-like ATPase